MTCFALRSGDVLDAEAQALVVPIDGTAVPRGGQFERLLGNVGRQFLRRFPEADLVEELEAQLDLPLPLGRAACIELGASPFKQLIVVSTLYHLEHLDFSAKSALVRTSVTSALEAARSERIQVIASPVLQGGWRLRPEDAFAAMLSALDTPEGVQILVYCNDQDVHDRLQMLARSLGRGE